MEEEQEDGQRAELQDDAPVRQGERVLYDVTGDRGPGKVRGTGERVWDSEGYR